MQTSPIRSTPATSATFGVPVLDAPDVARAARFYAELFGWDVVTASDGALSFALSGHPVARLRSGNDAASGRWSTCLVVDDIDDVVSRGLVHGARVRAPKADDGVFGTTCELEDPGGASVVLSQRPPQMPAPVPSIQAATPGNICWHELATSQVDRSGMFYVRVFGWQPEGYRLGKVSYTSFSRGTERLGGMLSLSERSALDDAQWLVYVAVAHCDEAVLHAKTLGAKVLHAPADVFGVGRFAVLTDPNGAKFAVLEPLAHQ
jgi:predicted enzyme related to lactoylglutathione lyase